MYKTANRFMTGSRKGSSTASQGRGGASESKPKKAANKSRKKISLAILAEERKILMKKQADQLRALKEQQRTIAEKAARTVLSEAIIASAKEHKRLRSEADFQKAEIRSPKLEQLASKARNTSRKEVVVVRRRDGREAKLRTGLLGQKAKPAPRRHK
jgi:hypothetical protein